MRVGPILLLAILVAAPLRAAEGLVVLVRHAEKVDDSRDAELSPAGKERAQSLAVMLRDLGIDAIYSTDFIRTRDTAVPLAALLGIEIAIYDGNALDELSSRLRKAGGRALVVGHSNTTPALVRKLGGEPGPEMDDDEYDRLYLVVIDDAGAAATALLRHAP